MIISRGYEVKLLKQFNTISKMNWNFHFYLPSSQIMIDFLTQKYLIYEVTKVTYTQNVAYTIWLYIYIYDSQMIIIWSLYVNTGCGKHVCEEHNSIILLLCNNNILTKTVIIIQSLIHITFIHCKSLFNI